MVTVKAVGKDSELAKRLLRFVEDCSWTDVREHIAGMIRAWEFTDWETMFAAEDIPVNGTDGKIVGMCSIMKTDYYPLPDIYPWISCVFVTEEYRGGRISEKLIEYANGYARELGFDRTYIPTDHVGLYERYGYRYVRDIVNYGGGTDRLYVKDL